MSEIQNALYALHALIFALVAYGLHARFTGTADAIRDEINKLLGGVVLLVGAAEIYIGDVMVGVINLILGVSYLYLATGGGGGGSLFNLPNRLPSWTKT